MSNNEGKRSSSRHGGDNVGGGGGGGRHRRRAPGKGPTASARTAAAHPAQSSGASTPTVGVRWLAISGTLLLDTATAICPLAPGGFGRFTYANLLLGADDAKAVETALERPGREAYLESFRKAVDAWRRDRRNLSTIKRELRDIERGGDVHRAGTRIVANHAMLSEHGKRTVSQQDRLHSFEAYVGTSAYGHGFIEAKEAGGKARKDACEDLLDGLRRGAPAIPRELPPWVKVPAEAPASASAAAGAGAGDDDVAEAARKLRNQIRMDLSTPTGKLTKDELERLEMRIKAADPRVRELLLHDRELADQLVQAVNAAQGNAVARSLDAVAALYDQCHPVMPVFVAMGNRIPQPARAKNKAIEILRVWFPPQPEPIRLRALHHPEMKKDVYAYLPVDQQREIKRLAETGSAARIPRDEVLDAVEAHDGARTILALRALAASNPDAVAALQRDEAFVHAIEKLDRPVMVGRQQLVPLQVCREMWSSRIVAPGDAEGAEPAAITATGNQVVPLTAEERLTLGVRLFDPYVEKIHDVMNGRSGKRTNAPFDYSPSALTSAWGAPNMPGRARAMRAILTDFEHEAAGEPYVELLRRERLAAGPELERRLEQKHHVSLTTWSAQIGAADRGHIARVLDTGPDASTRIVEGKVVSGDHSEGGKLPLQQALHQVTFQGKTFSEWTAEESQDLAKAIARHDADDAESTWNRFRFVAASMMPQLQTLTGVSITAIELMRNAFRVHAGDLDTRVDAAFTGTTLANLRTRMGLVARAAAAEEPAAATDDGKGGLITDEERAHISATFDEKKAKERAKVIHQILHDGSRLAVINVKVLSDLLPVERRIVLRAFRQEWGHDLVEYVREAMRLRAKSAKLRASTEREFGLNLDVQEVTIGDDTLTIHGSDVELEQALLFAQGKNFDHFARLRTAAGLGSGEQVQRVLHEMSGEQRGKVLGDGVLLGHMRAHLGQKAWEEAMRTLTAKDDAPRPELEESAPVDEKIDTPAEKAAVKQPGLDKLVAAGSNDKAVLRALGELSFDEAQKLQGDLTLQTKILAGLDAKHLALAKAILSQRSDAAGGARDEREYDALQAINRLVVALDQGWKAVLTQARAIYELSLAPASPDDKLDEHQLRLRLWSRLGGRIGAYAAGHYKAGGVTSDAITPAEMVRVIRDAVLGVADPTDALIAANIETVDERHARNARLSEAVGRPMAAPHLAGTGLEESSTVDEGQITEALREASPRHVVDHWTSVAHPEVNGRPSMKAVYDQYKLADTRAGQFPRSEEAAEAREKERHVFLQYVIGLSTEFERLLLPHMGDDRTATKDTGGMRTERRDNKRYNAMAQVIFKRVAEVPPAVIADALGMEATSPHRYLLTDPADEKRQSPNRVALARNNALIEEWTDRRGVGTTNIGHAVKKGTFYDNSVVVLNQDTATAREDDGEIDAQEAGKLASDAANVEHDRDAHKQALESEAAWKSLLISTIATVFVSVITGGLAGPGAAILLAGLTAGGAAVISSKIKEDILGVDYDNQDAIDEISSEVYNAVINAVGSQLAKQILKLSAIASRLERIKVALQGAPPWLIKALGGASEGVFSDAITMFVETGGKVVSGGNAMDVLSHAGDRAKRAALLGALQSLVSPEGGHKGPRMLKNLRTIVDPGSIGAEVVTSMAMGEEEVSVAGATRGVLGAVKGNAISVVGEAADPDSEHAPAQPDGKKAPAGEHLELGDKKPVATPASTGNETTHPQAPARAETRPDPTTSQARVNEARTRLDRRGDQFASEVYGMEHVGGAFKLTVGDKVHHIFVNPVEHLHGTADVDTRSANQIHFIYVDVNSESLGEHQHHRETALDKLVLRKLLEVAGGIRREHLAIHNPNVIVVAGDDHRALEYALHVKVEPGTLNVIVHGDIDHLFVYKDGKRHDLSAASLAKFIGDTGKRYTKLRLLACNGGAHPQAVAKHLANQFNLTVEAPSHTLFLGERGEIVIGPSKDQNVGTWVPFEPGVSSAREGGDATEVGIAPKASPTGDDSTLELGKRGGDDNAKRAVIKMDSVFANPSYEPSDAGRADLKKIDESRHAATAKRDMLTSHLAELVAGLANDFEGLGLKPDLQVIHGDAGPAFGEIKRLRKLAGDDQAALSRLHIIELTRRSLTEARRNITVGGESLGSRMSMDYVEQTFDVKDRIYPSGTGLPEPGKPGEFDFIYIVNGAIVIIEAKGGSSDLGTRKTAEGVKVEQGSLTYLDLIVDNMLSTKTLTTRQRAVLRMIRARHVTGKQVHYLLLNAPSAEGGSVKEFKQ